MPTIATLALVAGDGHYYVQLYLVHVYPSIAGNRIKAQQTRALMYLL